MIFHEEIKYEMYLRQTSIHKIYEYIYIQIRACVYIHASNIILSRYILLIHEQCLVLNIQVQTNVTHRSFLQRKRPIERGEG